MPQKRNPVPFEHVRAISSKALAQAQGVITVLHNTPFGDINDAEDDLQPLVFGATADAIRAIRIFGGVMLECEVDKRLMAERAGSNFLTVTELADTLVRREEVSFRQAYELVSASVKDLRGQYSATAMVDSVMALVPAMLGRPLQTRREDLLEALDPVGFVRIRRIPGGPGEKAVRPALEEAAAHVLEVEVWIEERSAGLTAYLERIRRACRELLAGSL
jgi:argininosuccinate lyase